MSYIITWSDGLGRVGTGEYLYDITEKPIIGFDFDSLYFETPTKMYIKILKGTQYALTSREIELCNKYCEDFYNSDAYMVHAIDSDLKTWVGYMPRGEMKRKELEEAVGATFPQAPYMKWTNNHWERIVAAIDENGSLWLLPEADNERFNFVFTELEWASFPKPEYDDQKFDFKTKQWYDARNFAASKKLAKDRVRAEFLSEFRKEELVHFEMDILMYMIQLREATNYMNNPSEASTPFVDAVLNHVEDTKETFMDRIMKHYSTEELTRLGTLHGEQQAILDKLSACTTLEELDAIALPLFKNTRYPWRRPMQVDPYASFD